MNSQFICTDRDLDHAYKASYLRIRDCLSKGGVYIYSKKLSRSGRPYWELISDQIPMPQLWIPTHNRKSKQKGSGIRGPSTLLSLITDTCNGCLSTSMCLLKMMIEGLNGGHIHGFDLIENRVVLQKTSGNLEEHTDRLKNHIEFLQRVKSLITSQKTDGYFKSNFEHEAGIDRIRLPLEAGESITIFKEIFKHAAQLENQDHYSACTLCHRPTIKNKLGKNTLFCRHHTGDRGKTPKNDFKDLYQCLNLEGTFEADYFIKHGQATSVKEIAALYGNTKFSGFTYLESISGKLLDWAKGQQLHADYKHQLKIILAFAGSAHRKQSINQLDEEVIFSLKEAITLSLDTPHIQLIITPQAGQPKTSEEWVEYFYQLVFENQRHKERENTYLEELIDDLSIKGVQNILLQISKFGVIQHQIYNYKRTRKFTQAKRGPKQLNAKNSYSKPALNRRNSPMQSQN